MMYKSFTPFTSIQRTGTCNRILNGVRKCHPAAAAGLLPLVALDEACTLILTDSGGIQEEAPSFGVPVLVMRETTERPEGVDAGTLNWSNGYRVIVH